jgi:hypothetical protein
MGKQGGGGGKEKGKGWQPLALNEGAGGCRVG